MKWLCVVLVCALATAAKEESHHTTPKPQVTRTILHVARSLDPESMETVNVRTRTGDIATLIVRKRGGKSSLVLPPPVSVISSSINVLEEEEKREGKSEGFASSNIPAPVTVKSSGFLTQEDNQQSGKSTEGVINIVAPPKDFRSPSPSLEEFGRDYNAESSREKKTIYVPPPVYVRSSPMSVKGEQRRGEDFWKRGRSVMHVDADGIPVIHGVRMPDDESDRQTWRNARVINGILVPYDKPSNNIESEDKQEIIRKVTVQGEDPATNKKASEGAHPIKPLLYTEISAKKSQYNYPHGGDTHARILEYINTVNQRETEKRGNVPPRDRMIRYTATRRSDEDGTGRSNRDSAIQARVLHYPGSPIYPTSLLYTPPSAKTSRVSFEEGVRTPVLQYAHPELGVQPAKVMSKQDDFEELEDSKQDTRRADRDKTNALTLAYFGQDIHSDRSPYAYEPGLETNEEPEVTEADSNAYKRSSNGEDDASSQSSPKPWPKSSLAYLHESQSTADTYGLGNDKYIKRYPYNGYNNVYSGSNKGSQNRYKGPISGSVYSKYPFGIGHYTIHAHRIQERPFWERIGDTIREHVQSGMEKVSDITRPVVEPLVEATHKISHNLGFASEDNRNVIQDKVGSTVAAYPVLLPALGLVAGGAALGLGAVAVGRFLDVDVMKRRIGLGEDDSEEMQVEHKRALDSIVKELNERESAREAGTWVVAEEFKNPGEQRKVLESAFRALNGQQSSEKYDRRRPALENTLKKVRDKEGEWNVADDSIKQGDLKILEDVIQSLKTPKVAAGDGTWVFVKNVNQRQKEGEQQAVNHQGVRGRVDDIRNMEDQEKATIQSIVETLAEQEGIGHRQGRWIVMEEGNEHENGRWVVDKDGITPNERQIKTKRSSDDQVIFLVDDDPKFQSSKTISMDKIDVSNTLRGERQLNQDLLGQTGQALTQSSVGNFHIVESDHRLSKRSAHESTMNDDVTLQQLPSQSHHIISKRSPDDSHTTYNKDDVISPQDGQQYLDNILHSLESSQQEVLAAMATLEKHRGDWSNTPCAKKIFCDVMVKQPADALVLIEKKMATFLSL